MSLEEYTADIVRVPMLTCDEEIILGAQVQAMMRILKNSQFGEQVLQENLADVIKMLEPQDRKTVKIGLRARDRMVSANMRLVVTVAKKAKKAQVHLTIQDLIQEGAIGLTRAAEKFEPGRGYKFSTYAYWWIRQGIVRATEYQEKAIRLPSNVQRTIKQVKEVNASLTASLGRSPKIAETAKELGESAEKIRKAILADVLTISLDSTLTQGEGSSTLLDVIPSGSEQEAVDAEDRFAKADFAQTLIGILPEDEQVLVCQRYGIGYNPMSVKEVAEYHGISEKAVKQKQQKALNKLRRAAAMMRPSDLRL